MGYSPGQERGLFPFVDRTQKGSSHRLSGLGSPAAHAPFLEAFRRGLRDYGYTERETILVEYRWADSQYDRLPQLAMELTRENVDLIVTYGSEGALAAKRTITTLPIVAVAVGDMVGAGVVANLARPEANVTGLSLLGTEVSEKRLSLLRDTIPDLGKVAENPGNSVLALQFKAVEAAARTMGIEILDCHYGWSYRVHPCDFRRGTAPERRPSSPQTTPFYSRTPYR